MSYSAYLASWFADHEDLLRPLGSVVLDQKTRVTGGERSVTTVVGLESASRFVELLVWDSGEVEYGYGTFDGPQSDEHHDIVSCADLEELLSRLVQFASASGA